MFCRDSSGKERDETGLDYFGARYFSGALGRFTSPDPVGCQLANPQSLNRYAYVLNNPLKFIDPLGMIVEWYDSKKTCKDGEKGDDCKSKLQRKYLTALDKMIGSNDADESAMGVWLKRDYDRLDSSSAIFEVTKGDSSGASRGMIEYKGNDHFEISLKGNDSAGLSDIQRVSHEFEHGRQILDGELSFWFTGKKWSPFAYDLHDEAKAFKSTFAIEYYPTNKFANNLRTMYGFKNGITAAAEFLSHYGDYKGKNIPKGPDNVPSGLSPIFYYPPK